jgi:hypothetical protein
MQINFSMNRTDYIQYYLYNASKNVQLRKRRSRTRLLTFLVCLPISLMYFYQDMLLMGGGFLAMGILWYTLLPRFDGRMHKKSFERYVDQNHKSDFEDKLKVETTKQKCVLSSKAGESVFALDAISSVEETADYLFIFMNNGQSLGVPKRAVSEKEVFINALLGAGFSSDKYVQNLDWAWK